MKDIAFVLVLGILIFIFTIDSIRDQERFEDWVLRMAKTNETLDTRMFKLNDRLTKLEEERDIEARVTELEKALRVFCTGTKTEMCGTLKTIQRVKGN